MHDVTGINGDIYAFATDLLDEGVDSALNEMLQGAGMSGVTIAATYHQSRDVFPHNPRRTVAFLDAGCYFRPNMARYLSTGIEPVQHESCFGVDPLAVAREATAARGAALNAWLVCLHDVPAGVTQPHLAQRNMFGDPMRTGLCPANPQVRAYLAAMSGDLARYECDSLIAEALHFQPFRHGYHHERCFVELDELGEFLLGLCFCAHCMTWAESAGVDASRVREWCIATMRRSLTGENVVEDQRELNREEASHLAGGEMGGFLQMRENVVSTLVCELVDALGPGTRFCFQDPTGSEMGNAAGDPQGGPNVDTGWQLGIDAAQIAAHVDDYRMLGYARDPQRLELEIRAIRRRIGSTPLSCVLRPSPPDAEEVQNLREKLELLALLSIRHVGFYHYGLLPRSRLAMIRDALESLPIGGRN
jgi:hypothetical protein